MTRRVQEVRRSRHFFVYRLPFTAYRIRSLFSFCGARWQDFPVLPRRRGTPLAIGLLLSPSPATICGAATARTGGTSPM
eukprot:1882119-Lingulodinium_polyedra.AAC.1